jgi:hypothetical protein
MRILRVTGAAKTSRLDIGGTTGQNESVEGLRRLFQLRWWK